MALRVNSPPDWDLQTVAIYPISENAGLYYMLIALIPIVLYYDFYLPQLNNAEQNYMKHFFRSELFLVLLQPIAMLFALGLFSLITFGDLPSYTIFTAVILLGGMFYFPGFITLQQRDGTGRVGIRYDVVSKIVRSCHIICLISLYAFICGLTGPNTFHFLPYGGIYNFPSQDKPPVPRMQFLDKNGEYAATDFSRGYFTHIIYFFAPESLYFFVMFYLSHLYLATSTRCLMFHVHFLIDVLESVNKWMTAK